MGETRDDSCLVITMPEAVPAASYCEPTAPKRRRPKTSLRALYGRATGLSEEPEPYEPVRIPTTGFTIPNWLRYEDGPFEHQERAVAAWCEAGYRGVLEMADRIGEGRSPPWSARTAFMKSTSHCWSL